MEIFGAEGQLIAAGIGIYMTVYDRRTNPAGGG